LFCGALLAESLSQTELAVVSLLVAQGLPRADALAAVVLVTRSYSRPKSDLVDTLRQYAGLEDINQTRASIERLQEMGWLTSELTYGMTILGPVADLRLQMAKFCKDKGLTRQLLELRRINDEYATIVGPLRDAEAFTTYVELLKSAQKHIYMPMVATSASGLESTPIILERSTRGVKVKILGATPSLAVLIRGEIVRAATVERIREWRALAKKSKNIQFRVTASKQDLRLASSIAIDSRVLRLVIYDFERERSKEGVVVEFSANDGRPLNIIEDFEDGFLEAWDRAREPGFLGFLLLVLKNLKQFAIGIMLTLVCYLAVLLFGKTGVFPMSEDAVTLGIAVLSSVAASYFFAGMIDAGSKSKRIREDKK
jgi:hypothetical protein